MPHKSQRPKTDSVVVVKLDLAAADAVFFFLLIRPPPISTQGRTLFPYTTLFRSSSTSCTSAWCAIPGCTCTTTARTRTRRSRSEEHTSELQSPFLISYAVFCLKKKKRHTPHLLLPLQTLKNNMT